MRFNTALSHTAQGLAWDQHQTIAILGWQLTALRHTSYYKYHLYSQEGKCLVLALHHNG